jgi:hypothetical protein
MNLSRTASSLGRAAISLVFLLTAEIGTAATFETGTLSGHQDNTYGVASGTFTFDPGEAGLAGVDYSPYATPATPGGFSVSTMPGNVLHTGEWHGQFATTGGAVVFGSTDGTYGVNFSTRQLTIAGPVGFNAVPPANPLPQGYANPRVSGVYDITNIILDGNNRVVSYDFSGPFELTAWFRPEVCVEAHRSHVYGEPTTLSVAFVDSWEASCTISQIELQTRFPLNFSPSSERRCVSAGDVYSQSEDFRLTIKLARPISPGQTWRGCFDDSAGDEWGSDQQIWVRMDCDQGRAQSDPAVFDYNYEIDAGTVQQVSEARIGTCAFDRDRDGVANVIDNCEFTQNASQANADTDTLGDACDNCVDTANQNQADLNRDGTGNACETRCDDGIDNDEDGSIDFPDDSYCSSPDDDHEEEPDCLDPLRGLRRTQPARISEISKRSPIELAEILHADPTFAKRLARGVAGVVECPRAQEQPDPWDMICVIGIDEPRACPPLDCALDGPGCMDPSFRRARIPVSAIRAAALWADGSLSDDELGARLARMEKEGSLELSPGDPKGILSPGGFSPGWAVLGVVGLVVLGFVLGRRGRAR